MALPNIILVREEKDKAGGKYLVADYNVEGVMTYQEGLTVVGTYKLVDTRRMVNRAIDVKAAKRRK